MRLARGFSRRRIPLVFFASAVVLTLLAAPAGTRPAIAAGSGPARLSTAGQQLFEEALESGHLLTHPLASAVREQQRLALVFEQFQSSGSPELTRPFRRTAIEDQANDVLVNDKTPISCTSCGVRPLSQAETSIAAHAAFVVGSWNDNKARCQNNGTQGLGYSVNHGASWTDLGFVPFTVDGSKYRGDPVVAVNHASGDFYVVGLDQVTPANAGVAVLRGHFSGGAFVVDLSRRAAAGLDGDFLDKPWLAVDSLSGNVYVTWTNFTGVGTAQIEMQRFDFALNPLGPRQVVFNDLSQGSQGTYPTVGPAGELYLPWTMYQFAWGPLSSQLVVVRSDDFGATFGPMQVIAQIQENSFSGGPGSLRGFGVANIAMAADLSQGPHRGRVYAVWDECVRYKDAPFGAYQSAYGSEPNPSWDTATPFVPGGKLRGAIDVNGDTDFYRFDGTAGQTFVLRPDSLSLFGANFAVRLVCSDQIADQTNWRILVNSQADPNAGGMVFTLPATGTYYLVLGGSGALGTNDYVLETAFDTPTAGERGRDERDQFVSYSDDGTVWSTPTRLNDDAPRFDGCFPSVTVDGLGRVHAFYFSWRADPVCGAFSDQYGAISGDGGMSWGPNRRITDVSSLWLASQSCSSANHGDYEQITSHEDHVYACFPDARLGDPDVFVDASVMRSDADCPPPATVYSGQDNLVSFTLRNLGNFATPLTWTLVDDAGWITGATPAVSGTQMVAADGGGIQVTATVHPPANCFNESSTAYFIRSDPFIAGRFDTCRTSLQCSVPTAVAVSLIDADVAPGHVVLVWYRADARAGAANVYRRGELDDWALVSRAAFDGTGRLRFEDEAVVPGVRYAYRVGWPESEQEQFSDEHWVDVPIRAELALDALSPNPTDRLRVAFSLPDEGVAMLELVDVSGRRLMVREVGSLGPGRHAIDLDGFEPWSGMYWLRLTHGGQRLVRGVMIVR